MMKWPPKKPCFRNKIFPRGGGGVTQQTVAMALCLPLQNYFKVLILKLILVPFFASQEDSIFVVE